MKSASAILQTALAPFRTQRALHIFVLCAFAFSQPLFSALTQQFVYLHDLQAGWFEVLYVIVQLTLVLPAGCIVLDSVVVYGSSCIRGHGRDAVLGVLFFLVGLSLIRPFMGLHYLQIHGLIWITSLLVAFVGAILVLRLYQKNAWVRQWVSMATVGLVCFPGLFLYHYGSLSRAQDALPTVAVAKPIPVVFIVFDEFAGASLMDSDLQIDAANFPQFAKLASLSTWYRHASTVHTRTDVAVPAILTGQFPTGKRPPLESEYPGNLFRLIQGSNAFDMAVFEPITRLCPNSVRTLKRTERTTWQKIQSITNTLATVYPRLLLPNDTPLDFPPISRLWFGLPETVDETEARISGLFREEPFVMRDGQLQKFLRQLRRTDKPAFRFLHVELPHIPWCFLPSGTHYNYNDVATFYPSGAWGEIGEDWGADVEIVLRNEHRYLQQLRFVDRFIGRLLDRLQEEGLLDECLLIVTADHGVSFRPGHSRRVPDKENLTDLLSVPLFVKLPRQTTSQVSDMNVEAVDILPTIAEVLGMELEDPVDGISLSKTTRRPRKTLYTTDSTIPLEPVVPHLTAVVERRLAVFGKESLDNPPLQATTHADWHGRSIEEFQVDDSPLPSVTVDPRNSTFPSGAGKFAPCLVAGSLDPNELHEPADLVVSVNGVIVDSGPAFKKGRVDGFEFLLPEALASLRPCNVELFHVLSKSERPKLRRLKAWNQAE